MKKYLLTLSVSLLIIISSCKKNAPDITDDNNLNPPEALRTISGRFVPNELLVRFKTGTSEKNRNQILSFINGEISEHILTKAMESAGDNDGIYLVNTTTDVNSAIARMKGETNIDIAEPNWIYMHTQVANDKYYMSNELWGMYSNEPVGATGSNIYASQADLAWYNGHLGSRNIAVGIIDEGIQFEHPDLKANIWTNPYDPIDKKDNDGNGYVDDIHGWDFDGKNNSIYDGGPTATSDHHGTHVAGTIGGIGGNGIGVAGVNWEVTMISAKFLGRNGGTTANAIKAVDYLTDLKKRHGIGGSNDPILSNLVASNNSWGGGGFSQLLLEAIARGANKDILFIAAAGNNSSDNDAQDNYPSNYNTENVTDPKSGIKCNYDAVIAVAALESDGKLASYSNYGSSKVDLGAPGTWIFSTYPPNTYRALSGTSMATPHVTGGVALYAATHSERGLALKEAIISSAKSTPTTSIASKTATGGRLNVTAF